MIGAVLERRALGRRLRRLREAAGMSRTAAGEVIDSSVQTVWRLEGGQSTRNLTAYVTLLCDAYGATDAEREVLVRLVRDVRAALKSAESWWRDCPAMAPDGSADRIVLEQVAGTMTAFSATLIPSLLQTVDYHRAAQQALHPHESDADLDRRAETLLQRQEVLHNNDFHARVYLLQSLLAHSVGGAAVMAQQLSYLDALAQLPNVSIRIVPHAVDAHIGLHLGSFVLLEFAPLRATGESEPPIIYVNCLTRELCVEQEGDIARYRVALNDLDRAALDEAQSRALISEVAHGFMTAIGDAP